MTKAELIRKIAKQSGVPDTEAKLFFEIFLRKAAGVTEQGGALLVPEFGYFLPKKGKMHISNFEGENLEVYLDLIVFNSAAEEKQDSLIFNVPETNPNESKPVDAYFSLSIGKPVIPLQGVKDVDFFLPPSGHELRRLIESKVEKIIDESEVIKNYKTGSDIVLINKDEFDKSQLEMNYNSLNQTVESKTNSESEIDIEDSIDYNEVNWNTSRDLSKEIEEESLLDIGKDYESIFEEETSGLSWNFGNVADENYNSNEEGTIDLEDGLKPNEIISESEVIANENNLISENDLDENEISQYNELEETKPIPENIEEEITDKETANDNIENENEELKSTDAQLSYEAKHLKQRKSYTWIFILVALLILAAAYFFMRSTNRKPPAASVNSNTEKINSTVAEKTAENTKIEAAVNKGNNAINTNHSVIGNLIDFPKDKIVKVSDNIYKYEDIYVVQVSSWKTKEKAVHQVELFNSAGRNAFLEEAKVGGTIWYRVRVGNFSSNAEAKQFLNKN